ncbi:unnamed protein product [Phaeothamnion confervicola]
MDLDQNTIVGIAAGVGGLALGIGLVAFTEQQGERTAARGDLSENVAAKLSAKLLEDADMDETDVESVTDRMRKALMADQTAEQEKEMQDKIAAKKTEEEDDGW